MNKKLLLVASFGGYLLVFLICQSTAGEVSTSPSHQNHKLIVAKNSSITFTASSETGNVTTSATATNGANVSGGSGESQMVTFGAEAEGKVTTVTFTVNHTDGETFCTTDKDFTFDVIVPKLEATEEDLWYTNSFVLSNYKTTTIVTVAPELTGVDSFDWGFDTSVRSFKMNGDDVSTKTTSMPALDLSSKSFSPNQNDNVVKCEFAGSDGNIKITKTFTVLTPRNIARAHKSDVAASPPLTTGYLTTYEMTIKDQFADEIPRPMPINEDLGPKVNDYTGNTWGWGSAPNGLITGASAPANFEDEYQHSLTAINIPTAVEPGQAGESTLVFHQTQWYRVCSSTVGDGIELISFTLNHYRGKARQQ